MTMTYAQQLRHPEWQRKRLVTLDRAGWKCLACGSKEKTLHVHHKKYVRGRKAWEYDDSDLTVLCEDCHEEHHCAEKEWGALFHTLEENMALDGVYAAMALVEVWFSLSFQEFPAKWDREAVLGRGFDALQVKFLDWASTEFFNLKAYRPFLEAEFPNRSAGQVLHEVAQRIPPQKWMEAARLLALTYDVTDRMGIPWGESDNAPDSGEVPA